MSAADPVIISVRQGRAEYRRLGWAIVISLLVHLAAWGTYELGHQLGWWEKWPVLAWMHRAITVPAPPPVPPPKETEPELTFLEVAEPDPVVPAKPKYYANNNSRAANPSPKQNQDTPELKGQQKDVPKTETARRTQLSKAVPQPAAKPTPQPLAQPSPQPPPKPTPQPKPPSPPPPVLAKGDLTVGKPQPPQPPQPDPAPAQLPRPRTLKEALARQPNAIAGLQMRQNGGARRVALRPTFDAKATPFGDYDAQLVQAVTQKWYDLLDSQAFAGERTGRVTLHFTLNYDGRVTEISMVDNNVGTLYGYLCQRALTEPAPFARWPEEMHRLIGGNTREMTFSFYYY